MKSPWKIVIVCLYPGWRRDDQAGTNVNTKGVFALDGVWFRCTMVAPIRFQCDFYGKSILGLPTWVQAMRFEIGLKFKIYFSKILFRSGSVLSLIASALAAFVALLATDCTNFVDMTIRQKAKMGIFVAFLEFFSGIALGICVSLYASNIREVFGDLTKYRMLSQIYYRINISKF